VSNIEPQPGDIILTGIKAQGIISIAIKLGCWLRRYPAADRRYSHAALVTSQDGSIVEAQATGVKRAHINKYQAGDYTLIHTHADQHDQAQILAYTQSVLNTRTRYGYVTFIGLAVYCLTGAQVCIQRAGTAICSGFVADALTRAGYIWPRPPYAMMPADLAQYFPAQGH
jgi:uncharacterized protein YycO